VDADLLLASQEPVLVHVSSAWYAPVFLGQHLLSERGEVGVEEAVCLGEEVVAHVRSLEGSQGIYIGLDVLERDDPFLGRLAARRHDAAVCAIAGSVHLVTWKAPAVRGNAREVREWVFFRVSGERVVRHHEAVCGGTMRRS